MVFCCSKCRRSPNPFRCDRRNFQKQTSGRVSASFGRVDASLGQTSFQTLGRSNFLFATISRDAAIVWLANLLPPDRGPHRALSDSAGRTGDFATIAKAIARANARSRSIIQGQFILMWMDMKALPPPIQGFFITSLIVIPAILAQSSAVPCIPRPRLPPPTCRMRWARTRPGARSTARR